MTTIMGHLLYGSPPASFEIDDRALAHAELVVLAKLRRNEAFALAIDEPGARSTIWINAASTLQFRYESVDRPAINRAWLDVLIDAANTAAGMRLIPEP
jgi:hypothetical protein